MEVMGDRYQLQEPIGRGGMATIYRGLDLRENRVVAIKVLREIYNTNPKFITRFQREAQSASALVHPNIVPVYDYGQMESNYYIVMELVEGTNLGRYLRARGVLDVNRAVIIAHDIALGLAAAHRRGIVHRDVKPQNILVGRNGSIKLTDFGIASVYQDMSEKRLTTTGMTLGTVQYYAPEQAMGEIVSPAADVYALGIVMYEMLTGRTPFDGDSPVTVAMHHIQDPPTPPSQFNPSIPVALEKIILRCLEKVPEMRYSDGSQLARALEKLGDAQPAEAASIPPERPSIPANPDRIPSHPENSVRGSMREHVPFDSLDTRKATSIPPNANDAGSIPGSPFNQLAHANAQPSTSLRSSATPHQLTPVSIPSLVIVRRDRRSSHAALIMSILIPLAILLLLGISTYLAVELGFINFPFGNNPTPTVTTIGTVPDLSHLTYPDAVSKAKLAGFKVQAQNGITTGVVIQQVPPSGDIALKGTTIIVRMGQLTPTPTPKTFHRSLANSNSTHLSPWS